MKNRRVGTIRLPVNIEKLANSSGFDNLAAGQRCGRANIRPNCTSLSLLVGKTYFPQSAKLTQLTIPACMGASRLASHLPWQSRNYFRRNIQVANSKVHKTPALPLACIVISSYASSEHCCSRSPSSVTEQR